MGIACICINSLTPILTPIFICVYAFLHCFTGKLRENLKKEKALKSLIYQGLFKAFGVSVGYEKDAFAFFVRRAELSLIKHYKYIYVIKGKNNISLKHIIHINLRLFYHIIIRINIFFHFVSFLTIFILNLIIMISI